MRKFNNLLKKSEFNNNGLEDDIIVELSADDADKVMAVGNSVQSGKWFMNEDMKYTLSKKMF